MLKYYNVVEYIPINKHEEKYLDRMFKIWKACGDGNEDGTPNYVEYAIMTKGAEKTYRDFIIQNEDDYEDSEIYEFLYDYFDQDVLEPSFFKEHLEEIMEQVDDNFTFEILEFYEEEFWDDINDINFKLVGEREEPNIWEVFNEFGYEAYEIYKSYVNIEEDLIGLEKIDDDYNNPSFNESFGLFKKEWKKFLSNKIFEEYDFDLVVSFDNENLYINKVNISSNIDSNVFFKIYNYLTHYEPLVILTPYGFNSLDYYLKFDRKSYKNKKINNKVLLSPELYKCNVYNSYLFSFSKNSVKHIEGTIFKSSILSFITDKVEFKNNKIYNSIIIINKNIPAENNIVYNSFIRTIQHFEGLKGLRKHNCIVQYLKNMTEDSLKEIKANNDLNTIYIYENKKEKNTIPSKSWSSLTFKGIK